MDDEVERLRIKQMAAEDRPREKLLLKGVTSLSDAELIAILIGSGNKNKTAVQLAQQILNDASNNLNTLGKLTVKDLESYKGIGEAKAISIVAAMELGRRKRFSEPEKRDTVRSSKDIFNIFYGLVCDIAHEELWIALINNAGRVIEKDKISQGGVGETSADIRLIMKKAINTMCQGIVLCHNHPSGNLQPSAQDDLLTKRLKDAAILMNIKLLDHIIISDNKYYSYADEGRI
jgi:DNA repair protein RadC